MMTIKHFLLINTAIVLVQCGSPTKNNNTSDKSKNAKDSCCAKKILSTNNQITMKSEITCPKCGYKKKEVMPTNICVIKYNCEKCNEELRPKNGDCCVFCTHGTHKCPSMQ